MNGLKDIKYGDTIKYTDAHGHQRNLVVYEVKHYPYLGLTDVAGQHGKPKLSFHTKDGTGALLSNRGFQLDTINGKPVDTK